MLKKLIFFVNNKMCDRQLKFCDVFGATKILNRDPFATISYFNPFI
jgi:hypothetical protein